MEHTINANFAECVRQITHLGYFRFHNVCRSTFYDAPWGFGDWIGLTLLTIIVAAFGFGILAIVVVASRKKPTKRVRA